MTINVGARVRELTHTQETAATRTAVASSRMAFVDNLRVFLTILVVLHHLAITYGAEGSWFYLERPTTEMAGILLTLFVSLNQFYFMGLFFLISGYFVPGGVDRKGSGKYMKDRLIRLGIPLVLYSLLISPIVEYAKAIHEGYYSGNIGQFFLRYWQRGDIAPGPLWFVEILLVFSLVYVLGRALLSRGKAAADKMTPTATKKPLTHWWILACILFLGPLNFVVRIFSPIGSEWNHQQLAFFPQYIFLFPAGILAYRRGWLPDLPAGIRKFWSVIAVLAILALPAIMVFGGATESMVPFEGGITWQSALVSAWEAVYCVSMSILLLNVFRHRFDYQGRLSRVLSQNAYSVYIIHPPIIVGLAVLLSGVSIDPLLKFIFIAPLALAVCFLACQLLVRRIPMAEKVL